MIVVDKRATHMTNNEKSANWASGRVAGISQAEPTGFDAQVQRLGLNAGNWDASKELREWCERNKNHCYIPEELLAKWGIAVNGD
jgi:hypothetical protein